MAKTQNEKLQDALRVVEADIGIINRGNTSNGLIAIGKVIGRRRKEIKKEGEPTRFLLTISLLTDEGVLKIDEWSDDAMPKDLPEVGKSVRMPVTVRAFNSKAGVQTRLNYGAAEGGQEV